MKKENPNLDIVIIEKEFAGYGASGRNGGWCSPTIAITPNKAIENYGIEIARNLQLTMFDTVKEVEKIIKEENLDVDWVVGGSLILALGTQGLPMLENQMSIYKKLNIEDKYELLNEEETQKRVNVNKAIAGLLTKYSAALNPAKLVRQLANILENKGVKIFEQTEVIDVIDGDTNNPSKLITKYGTVTSRFATVLAGEAYMSQISKYHRELIPVYSLITLTEPLTEEQWKDIGWNNRETIGSTRYSINYLQKTADGRILFGGRGQPYRFGSKIKSSYDFHKSTHETLQNMLRKWFPTLSDIKFTHSWGGPLGMTRDWTPNFIYNPITKIASAWGYVGQGVSTTNLAGRILTDLMFEKKTDITELPMVQYKSKKWEIEPIRWLGARFVQYGLERVDRKAERTGIPPTGTTLSEKLSKH